MKRLAMLALVLTTKVFADVPQDLNMLLYGDAGKGNEEQFTVADGMLTVDRLDPFDFALSLGDNQYTGIGSEVMKAIFEEPYKNLIQRGLVFFQTIGNHDMEFGRRNAQLQYSREQNVLSRKLGGWALPADDYEIVRGDVRWIVINVTAADVSVLLPSSRLDWLQRKLCGARERWVFLAMHYPMWSSNYHGDNLQLQDGLAGILQKCSPDGVFGGHDHGAEVIRTPLGIRQFVVGNAAEAVTPSGKTSGISEWRYGRLGFAALKVSGSLAKMTFFSSAGNERYSVEWSPVRKRNRL